MTEPNDDFICFKCKHYKPFAGGCEAFPDEIPDEIIFKGEHSTPLPDQGNDIVFEPKEKEDAN